MSAGQLRAMMITGSCSAEVSFAVGSIFSRPSYWLVAIAAFAIGFYWEFRRVWKDIERRNENVRRALHPDPRSILGDS